jgi:hypothetical protein
MCPSTKLRVTVGRTDTRDRDVHDRLEVTQSEVLYRGRTRESTARRFTISVDLSLAEVRQGKQATERITDPLTRHRCTATSRILSRSESRQACSQAAGSGASVSPWVKTGLLARRSPHARTHCAPPRTFSEVSPLRTAARVLACVLTRPLRDVSQSTG